MGLKSDGGAGRETGRKIQEKDFAREAEAGKEERIETGKVGEDTK